MDAVVNIKMTPTDFDLLRSALDEAIATAHETAVAHSEHAASLRQRARAREAQLLDLQRKLK